MIYYAENQGLFKNENIAEKLYTVLNSFKGNDEEKSLIFNEGTYIIESNSCFEDIIHITNTIGENEYEKETPHRLMRVGIYLNGINNLHIKGNNTVILFKGRVTNMALIDCKNITVEGITFKTENPDLHFFKCEKSSLLYTDFSLDKGSRYVCENNMYYFSGTDYKTSFLKNIGKKCYWHCRISGKNLIKNERHTHPFNGLRKIKETAPYKFRVYYKFPKKYNKGDYFGVFDTARKNVGIFVDKSENIRLFNITQNFNHSLAVVCQDSENITVEKCNFLPDEENGKLIASLADFIQISLCRGQITVKDNCFTGSADDCLNVHGFFFKLRNVSGSLITVTFEHPQTYGFNPFHAGDEIEYTDNNTLLSFDKSKVISSTMKDEYTLILEVEKPPEKTNNVVIENISSCPDLLFANNRLTRINARGILFTTRGRVVVDNNIFESTKMSHILVSCDASNWYESGKTSNVYIKNNVFEYTDANNIFIKPENSLTHSVVHGKFVVENNKFLKSEKGGIFVRSADSFLFKGNEYPKDNKKFFDIKDVSRIDIN